MLCVGAGGLGSPAGALPRRRRRGHARPRRLRRRRLQPTCSGRSSTARPTSAARSSTPPPRCIAAINPERRRRHATRPALTRDNALEHLRGLRRHRRRHRQLPDALPRQRRLRAPRQAQRLRLHLPLRGPGVSVFATEDGPCYRCLYPEPPPPGLVPSLRRRRRARRAARAHRRDPGHRGHQAHPRHRRDR